MNVFTSPKQSRAMANPNILLWILLLFLTDFTPQMRTMAETGTEYLNNTSPSSSIVQTAAELLQSANANNEPQPQQQQQQKSLKMVNKYTDLREKEFPLVTEIPWSKVNLSDVGYDDMNPSGFIRVACYQELTNIPHAQLYNRTFRFVIQRKLEGRNKLCMLRFPTGLRLQYRFEFQDPNTYVFFAFGHHSNLTVATSRLLSKTEKDNLPFQWWKGIIFVPCRFSTLVFHPYAVGEVFEFRILDIPYEYQDKCSKLEAEYY